MKHKKIVILIVIAALLVGLTGGFRTLSIFGGDLGETQHPFTVHRGGHQLCDVTGHMVLDDVEYATGWKPDSGGVKSEKMVMSHAEVGFDSTNAWNPALGWWFVGLGYYHYEWFINDALVLTSPSYVGANLQVDEETQEIIQMEMTTHSFTNLTGSHTGILRCEMVSDIYSAVMDIGWIKPVEGTDEDVILCEWNAKLLSGEGYVKLGDSLPDVIEEGGDVEFVLKTGSTGGEGWTCYIISPSGEKIEFTGNGFTGQDGFGPTTCSFTVPTGWFVEGGDNECEIQLYNHLWMESVSTWFVIDDIEKQPGKPTITYTTDYYSGSRVDVQVSATPNPITGLPIDYFRVYVYYGEPGSMPGYDFPSEFLIMGADYPAASNAASFSFTTIGNREGQVTIKVNAIDEAGRASMGAYKSMDFYEKGGGPLPDDIDYPWQLTLSVILALLGGIVALVLIYQFVPLPLNFKYVVMMIVLAITAYAVYYFGTHPGAGVI